MKEWLRHIYRVLNPKYQTVNLDYPVEAVPRYTSQTPHSQLLKLMQGGLDTYEKHLRSAVANQGHFADLQAHLSKTDFKWRNDYLPAWDGVMLHTMIGLYKPTRYLEVGSGYSTLVCRQAIKDHNLDTRLTSIDPQPRASISGHSDQLINKRVETIDLTIFSDLSPRDILFIDNSHRLLPNSDVTVFFLDILPRLRSGVIVHIHDIYLPFDYPPEMCSRMYSEQYALAIALLSNPDKYEILMPSYFVSQHSSLSQILDPIWQLDSIESPESHGGSFWFSIR